MNAKQDPAIAPFSHTAMATVFKAFIAGQTCLYAEQAAAEAFRLVDRIEEALSRHVEYSDVSQISRLKAHESARVGEHAFACLKTAAKVWGDTDGAFDLTVGALTKAGKPPSAQAPVGMKLIELDDQRMTVRVLADGVNLDLGGIGKGYALDCAADLLREWAIASALLNAGDSTALAMGAPPGKAGWAVRYGSAGSTRHTNEPAFLKDRALSGSGTAVKGAHIVNPRTRKRTTGRVAAWAACRSAAVADALSTAFMVMPIKAIEAYCREHSDTSAAVVHQTEAEHAFRQFGAPFQP